MATEEVNEFLEHYGVPGMKWGVRRSKEERTAARDAKDIALGRATKVERKAAKKSFKEEAYGEHGALGRRIERDFLGKTGIGKVPYSELSTERRTIKAGETFYRVSGLANEPVRGLNDIKFVSTNDADRTRYNAVLAKHKFTSGLKDIKPTYEHTLKTTKKLTMPSEKERIDAFAELMDTKSVKFGPNKTLTGREVLKNMGYKKEVKRLDSVALGQQYFQTMQTTAWKNQGLADAYFENLRKKGFNAVSDDNDLGVLSKDPIILLNPNGTIKQMKVQQLQPKDITKAMAEFRGKLEDD